MFKMQPTLIALACVLLTACATSNPSSMAPSIVPTIACHEDDPSDPLPAYPSMPGAFGADSLMTYVRAQVDWAVQAAGIYRREKARRAATSKCLANLRKAGLIN